MLIIITIIYYYIILLSSDNYYIKLWFITITYFILLHYTMINYYILLIIILFTIHLSLRVGNTSQPKRRSLETNRPVAGFVTTSDRTGETSSGAACEAAQGLSKKHYRKMGYDGDQISYIMIIYYNHHSPSFTIIHHHSPSLTIINHHSPSFTIINHHGIPYIGAISKNKTEISTPKFWCHPNSI